MAHNFVQNQNLKKFKILNRAPKKFSEPQNHLQFFFQFSKQEKTKRNVKTSYRYFGFENRHHDSELQSTALESLVLRYKKLVIKKKNSNK